MQDANTYASPGSVHTAHQGEQLQMSPSQSVSGDTILVIEESPELRQLLVDILQEDKYTILATGSGRAALALLATQAVDLVLLDVNWDNTDDLALSTEIQRQAPVPVILLFDEYREGRHILHHPSAIAKPFKIQQLLDAVQLVLQGRKLAHQRTNAPSN